MADQTQPPPEPPPSPLPAPLERSISPEELARFYAGNRVKGNCTECGANQWTVDGASADTVPALMVMDSARSFGNRQFPALVLSCGICGNVKMFARLTVLRWLEAHPK